MPRFGILAGSISIASLIGMQSAHAFDDDGCAKVEVTKQTTQVDVQPNESFDAARSRAIDKLSEQAVYQVVGYDIESSRADSQHATNDIATSEYQQRARSSYKGLVRVKLIDLGRTGFDDHPKIEVTAEVSVCVPKSAASLQADKEKAERDKLPPHTIDPETAGWFDPVSGEGRVWYWASPNGEYKFFDKAGYDPATGDPLRQADRQFVKDWRIALTRKRKDAQDAALAQQQEVARREAAEAAARQLVDARAAEAARVVLACDTEAANPNDSRKPSSVTGVQRDSLKLNADAAVHDCEAAVRLQPTEPRYRYQLARAYSIADPKRSMPMFKRLCDERYPAAYDNYGWALLDRRVGLNDLDGAVHAFDQGISAGDSDAMTSMAGLMIRERVNANYADEPLQLYRRAAQKGNQDAALALTKLEAEREAAETARTQQEDRTRREAAQQEQAGRIFMGIVGGALANAGRR